MCCRPTAMRRPDSSTSRARLTHRSTSPSTEGSAEPGQSLRLAPTPTLRSLGATPPRSKSQRHPTSHFNLRPPVAASSTRFSVTTTPSKLWFAGGRWSAAQQGLAADTSQLGVSGSGSLLAFNFCGFGVAGQRWLAQLKPVRYTAEGLGALPKARSRACFLRFARLVARYSAASASRRWQTSIKTPARVAFKRREETLRSSAVHRGYSVCEPRLRPGSEVRAPPVAVVRTSRLRSPGRRLRLGRTAVRTTNLRRRGLEWPPAGGFSKLRIFARRPAVVRRYTFGAPPEPVVEVQIRGRRTLRSQGCQGALCGPPHNTPLQLSGRGFCKAKLGGRTAARFYGSRVCS